MPQLTQTENRERANPARWDNQGKREVSLKRNNCIKDSDVGVLGQQKGSAADAENTNGAVNEHIDRSHHTNEWYDDQERRNWGGCLRYFDGCACNDCEAAERRQNAAFGLKVRS